MLVSKRMTKDPVTATPEDLLIQALLPFSLNPIDNLLDS